MQRIMIADDQTLFRVGLKSLIETLADLQVVGEAANGTEALEVAEACRPDVLLLDVTMPGRGGLETLREIKSLDPRIHVLMLTAQPEDHCAFRALRNGADGYITKDRAPEELVAAIDKVSRGGKYISPTLAEKLAVNFATAERPIHDVLSDREFEVLRLTASGKTMSEIGRALSLSVKTVSTYRTRLLKKLGLRNNVELMRLAIQEGLAET